MHETSQLPSKMALGKALLRARGRIQKKIKHQRVFCFFFSDFLIIFDVAFFVYRISFSKRKEKHVFSQCFATTAERKKIAMFGS